MQRMRVLTIGHSTHSFNEFVALLRKHDVTAVADVRSSPFSRRMPHFNLNSLRTALPDHQIQYVFLGRELGARSSDPECYVDGRVDYARLASTALFREGIKRVLDGVRSHRIALMCAEKDPLDCHRTVLVAQTLVSESVEVDHILADGSVESHDEAMLRLLARFGMQQTSLLRSAEELIREALVKQEHRIAYVDADLAAMSSRSV